MTVPGRISAEDERLIHELYGSLRRFAGVVGSPDAEPDDLVQEAFLRVLKNRHIASLDNPGAYLRRVIVNLASSAWRRQARQRRAFARLSTPDGVSMKPVYPSDVADLLHLKPEARAVVYLHDVEGFDFGDIAGVLGMNVGSVRVVASRSRRRLRILLAKEAKR